jgi:hypothetical protein
MHGVHRASALQSKERASVLVWYGRHPPSRLDRADTCGFGLAFLKNYAKLGIKVIYIDLVCSQEKKAKEILETFENYGREQGATTCALRATNDKVIELYTSYGYHRVANACSPSDADNETAPRLLDKYSVKLTHPIASNGTDQAVTLKKAWAIAMYQDPTLTFTDYHRLYKRVPSGWYIEYGNQGFWMSKCIDEASTNHLSKSKLKQKSKLKHNFCKYRLP